MARYRRKFSQSISILFGSLCFCSGLWILLHHVSMTSKQIVLASMYADRLDFLVEKNATKPAYEYLWEVYFGGKPVWVDCKEMIDDNYEYLENYNNSGRITVEVPHQLSMECSDIRARVFGNQKFYRLRHPYAIARNVFNDYFIQEVLLAFSYSPYNLYCYAVDKNASQLMDSLRVLSECLPNIIVLEETYRFDSAGHFQDMGHLDCVKTLLSHKSWEYVMLLQTHDILIKSPEEISTAIDILDGMPLIDLEDLSTFTRRVPKTNAWTPRALKLFRPDGGFNLRQEISQLAIHKSSNQCFLSRAFCKEILSRLDFTSIFGLFNNKKLYGIDEMLMATLVTASFMGLSGQIESNCTIPHVLRYVHWESTDTPPCKSGEVRHSVCLLGVEYLSKLASMQSLVANKIWPATDFGTVLCMGELLYNRSTNSINTIDRELFSNLPHVREQKAKKRNLFDPAAFDCQA